ncbi:MAG: glycosyl transferase family 1 [Ilumatobacteraceae bacterium]|nr:glycosyl transferase family 1 [Ilumatobacteraceae bacterium]
MTHVLMTTDAVGGVWTYCLDLAGALAAAGVQTSLAILGPAPTAAQRADLASSAVVRAAHHPGALEWMDDPWADVDDAGRWLLDLETAWQPDVVHLNGFVHAVLDWRAPTVVVAHSDVVAWWHAVHGAAPPAAWRAYADRVGAGLAAATAVIAPTAAALADTERIYGRTGGSVVPNGRRGDWLIELDKEPIIIATGRMWDEAKNLASLRAVATRLDWPVVVAGAVTRDDADGRPPEAGDDEGPVVALGPLAFAELAPWLARAAVHAAPARYEPFGLGVLEAAMSGCALVLGDIASLREVWADAATYVAPDDLAALAQALTDLIHDPVRCAQRGAAAREHARRYTATRMAAGYAEVYRGVLADRPCLAR